MQLWKFSLVKLLRWKPATLHVLARYYAHSVFLPKQESSKFVLKTTPFTTPLFSTNDHLLGSSVVIFLKILGWFNAELMPCQKVVKMTCGRCAQFFCWICLFWSFTFFLILIATRLNFKTTWQKETTGSPHKRDKKVFQLSDGLQYS